MTKEAMKLALEAIEYVHDTGDTQTFDMCYAKPAITAIKEALAQPEQEPVLWMMPDGKTADKWALQFYSGQLGKPLYTTPPQRTWVGLTDEDDIDWEEGGNLKDLVKAIEAKLKEKNT